MLAAVRRDPHQHLGDVGDAEDRLAGEQQVQQHAAGEHVALGGGALRAQRRRLGRASGESLPRRLGRGAGLVAALAAPPRAP